MEAFETWLEGRSPLGRTADAAMRLVDWGLVGFALTDWLKRRPLLTPLTQALSSRGQPSAQGLLTPFLAEAKR